MRKMFINYWHRQELSTGKLKDIAFRMRHSLFVAMESYRKINASEIKSASLEPAKLVAAPAVVISILAPSVPAVIPIIAPAEVKLAPIAPPRVYFNPREYSQQYREAHRDEVNRKQQRNYDENKLKVLAVQIVRKLNHAQTITPTAKSILKYSLSQNLHTGKWQSA